MAPRLTRSLAVVGALAVIALPLAAAGFPDARVVVEPA
jgi:hypothetical protein